MKTRAATDLRREFRGARGRGETRTKRFKNVAKQTDESSQTYLFLGRRVMLPVYVCECVAARRFALST